MFTDTPTLCFVFSFSYFPPSHSFKLFASFPFSHIFCHALFLMPFLLFLFCPPFICHSFLITPSLCFISIQSKKMALGVICASRRWQNGGRHQRSQRCHQAPNLCWCLPVTHSHSCMHHTYLQCAGEKEGKRLSIIRCDTSRHECCNLTWQPYTHVHTCNVHVVDYRHRNRHWQVS